MSRRLRAAALPWRYAALALPLSIVVALAYLALRDAPAVSVIEGQTLSWRFQLRGKLEPPANVVILAVDDRTVAKLGRWPIPHQELATAVRKLADRGATAICLDLLLLDREPPSNGFQLSPGDRA